MKTLEDEHRRKSMELAHVQAKYELASQAEKRLSVDAVAASQHQERSESVLVMLQKMQQQLEQSDDASRKRLLDEVGWYPCLKS